MVNDQESRSAEIMFAVFDGEKEITDKMFEEAKNFAAFIKQQESKNQ